MIWLMILATGITIAGWVLGFTFVLALAGASWEDHSTTIERKIDRRWPEDDRWAAFRRRCWGWGVLLGPPAVAAWCVWLVVS